jgi:hypothetical protein
VAEDRFLIFQNGRLVAEDRFLIRYNFLVCHISSFFFLLRLRFTTDGRSGL